MFVYCALNLFIWVVIKLSGGAILPTDYEQKEYWTWKPEGEESWFRKLISLGRQWKEERQERKRNPSFPLTSDGGESLHHSNSEEKVPDRVPSPQPFRPIGLSLTQGAIGLGTTERSTGLSTNQGARDSI